MAEVVGLAASVIAVLQLTGSVISFTYNIGTDFRDAKDDSNRLRAEAEALREVLQAAEKLVTGPGALRFPVLQELLTKDSKGLAKLCAKEVASVQKALSAPWMTGNTSLPQQTNRGRGLLKRVIWPLQKKRLESALEGIRRLQDAIVQAMATDTGRTTVEIKSVVERLDTGVINLARTLDNMVLAAGETHKRLQAIGSKQEEEAARMAQERDRVAAAEVARRAQEIAAEDARRARETAAEKAYHARKERETILQRLEAPKQAREFQYAKYSDLRDRRDKNTSRWLLGSEEFTALLHPPAPGPSTLWLKGSAGCGKTMLTAAVLEHIQTMKPDAALAYFFFDFNNSEASTSETMLRSLVVQLVSTYDAPLPDIVTKFAAVHFKNAGERPSIEDVLHMLRDLVQYLTRDVIIVLDALDECTDRSIMLQRLRTILQWDLPLRIFMTSHDLSDVAALIRTQKSASVGVVRADSDDTGGDIHLFVDHQLETDPDLKRWPAETRNKIQEMLASRAHSMFRWVTCQIEMLQMCDSEEDVETALESLPTTLAATYTAALQRLPIAKRRRTLIIILWLLVSTEETSSPEAISEFLAVDLNDPTPRPGGTSYFKATRRILDPQITIPLLCPSLIRLEASVSGSAPVLTLAHSTVRDYLLQSEDFWTTFGADLPPFYAAWSLSESLTWWNLAHAYAAKALLGYVLSLQGPEDVISRRQFASGAATGWSYHFNHAETAQSCVQDIAFALYEMPTGDSRDIFATYVRALDLVDSFWEEDLRWATPYGLRVLVASYKRHEVIVEKLLMEQIRGGCRDDELYSITTAELVCFFEEHIETLRYTEEAAEFEDDSNYGSSEAEWDEIGSLLEGSVSRGSLRENFRHLSARSPDYAFLVKSGWGPPGFIDSPDCPPFVAACLSGRVEQAREMVVTGAVDPKRPIPPPINCWEIYPLFLAVYAGEHDVAAACLESGAFVNQLGNKTSPVRSMAVAIWAGRLDLVKLLVKYGAAFNTACSPFGTPLQTAIARGQYAIVEYFLSKPKVDVKRTVHEKSNLYKSIHALKTPLEAAVYWNRTQIAELLLARSPESIWAKPCKVSRKAFYSLIEMASVNGNIYLARKILAAFTQQAAGAEVVEEQMKLSCLAFKSRLLYQFDGLSERRLAALEYMREIGIMRGCYFQEWDSLDDLTVVWKKLLLADEASLQENIQSLERKEATK